MDILALLEAKGMSPLHASGSEYKITCINQGAHADGFDANPSLYINVDKRAAFCQTCGFRMNEVSLVKWLVGDALDDFDIAAMTIKGTLRRIQEAEEPFLHEAEEFTMMPPSVPWDRDYRGISKEFYHTVGARYCTVGRYTNRIIFPIYVNGRLRGFDSRALGDEKPKYLRSKGFDSLNEGLYPFDYIVSMKPKYVILCEGIFDSLNACYHGFPALNIFGVRTWSMPKFNLVLSTGASEVIMLMDNDAAGQKASIEIAQQIKDWLPVYAADTSVLVDGKDLGDLTADEILYCVHNRRKMT